MTADVAQEEFKDVLAWWKELLGAAVGQVNILAQSPTPSHCYDMLFLPRSQLAVKGCHKPTSYWTC